MSWVHYHQDRDPSFAALRCHEEGGTDVEPGDLFFDVWQLRRSVDAGAYPRL